MGASRWCCRAVGPAQPRTEGMNSSARPNGKQCSMSLVWDTPSFVRYGGLVHLGKGASRAAGYSCNACRWGSTGRAPCRGICPEKAWAFGREYVGVAERVDDPADPRLSGVRRPPRSRSAAARRARRRLLRRRESALIGTVIGAGRRVRSVLVTPVQHDALVSALATIDAPVYVAEPAVLRRVVGFDLHRGAVASVDRWPLPSVPGLCAPARRVVVLNG